jgi:hypothetical protein
VIGDGPDDVDAAFAEIVADLEREGVGRDVETLREDTVRIEPVDPAPATSASWRGHDTEFDWAGDNERYEPPEPPPLPRLRPLTILAMVLLIIGVLLLALPGVIGLSARIATPIALIAVASGIGLLLLRIRKTPRDYPGDGAQV